MQDSLTDRLNEGIAEIMRFLPRLAAALGILMVGFAIAKMIERGTDLALHRIGFDRWMREGGVTEALERAGTSLDPSTVIAKLAFWTVMLLVILLGANALGIAAVSTLFAELLDEALEGGHRVLVFSQFVEMLQLIVPQLAEKGIDFCYLDGRTRNRADVVKRFQTKEVPVFLISLKAGGVGLNLTEADYCFMLDPWWNPAAEAQAIDRTHRIGQEHPVVVYRMVAQGTIEEKVMALAERKRELAGRVLAGDEGAAAARLSAEDIKGLLDG